MRDVFTIPNTSIRIEPEGVCVIMITKYARHARGLDIPHQPSVPERCLRIRAHPGGLVWTLFMEFGDPAMASRMRKGITAWAERSDGGCSQSP